VSCDLISLARAPHAAVARVALAALLALGACKDEPPPATEKAAEAPTEKKPAVDPKIANAVAAAEASARSESNTTSNQAAPPPNGILGTEAAARELAAGAPAQIVLGGEGSTPRVKLGGERMAPGPGPAGKLSVSYRSGGSVMPTIEFDLKPKVAFAGASAQAATQPASVPAAPAASEGNLVVSFALAGARPAENQPGRLPENARAEIAKLNGSSIELVTQPNGALVEQRQKVSGNNPDLEPIVTGSSEALASLLLPYPDVPVGVGAFWMIKSRETLNGAPVIVYRMVKLTELSPTANSASVAKLNVNTRRYLIESSLPLEGLPPHQVRRFESEGEATLSIKPGSPFPESADTHDGFMALVTPNDRPSQALPIRSELTANASFQR
jgi:hypothetical protein